MKGWTIIFRRELAGLFLSPLAWVLFCVALIYNAGWFIYVLRGSGGEVNGAFMFFLSSLPFWLLIVVLPPLLTMRMISEESRSGLLEYLLTAPVGDAAVVVGKALAATTFLSLIWASLFLYGLVVQLLGAPPDWGMLFTQWLGATLVSGLFCALGLVASALSSTPLVAAFLAIVANMVVILLPAWSSSIRFFRERETLARVTEYFNVLDHYQGSFLRGALDSAHLIFFVVWTLTLLFLAVRLVESRRWLA